MPTNDERREVAAKLREKHNERAGTFEPQDMYIQAMNRLEDILECLPKRRDMLLDLADLIEPESINGETSDGYHTFNALYHHRALLFSVVVRNYPELCWKSKKHHADDMYEGMFIVGIDTPDGQASYHYDIEPYWDMFDCEELEYAPEWDGHTPEQAIERIGKLTRHEPEPKRTCRIIAWYEAKSIAEIGRERVKLSCGHIVERHSKFCSECGARVVRDSWREVK